MGTVSLPELMQCNLENTKCFVQLLFDSLQNQIKELRDENNDLKRSVEFAHQEIKDLKDSAIHLQILVNNQDSDCITDLKHRTRLLEFQSRSKNVRIAGLHEVANENYGQTTHVSSSLKNSLKDIKEKKAYRIGAPGTTLRHVIARLKSTDDKKKSSA